MAIFEGDLSGTPNKKGMTVIGDRNNNIRARDPLGIPQFFSFNTATVWGHAHDDAHWYAQKSHEILMILSLLCGYPTISSNDEPSQNAGLLNFKIGCPKATAAS